MANFWKKYKRQILIFLAVAGPGLITAMADNDAGGVATYSVAAALYGMSSQYFIILTTVLLAVTQEIGARIAIVTGSGLGDLIREHYGVRTAVFLFIAYFVVNQGVVLQDVTGLKSSIQLLDTVPWLPWELVLILSCLLLIALVIILNYKNLQRIFLITILFYATYIFSAVLSHPNWGQAIKLSLFVPERAYITNLHYWFTLIAVLGTTVTAWGQFFVHSYIADKGLKPEHLNQEKAEVYSGAILTNFFSWMIAIAVTYTVFVNHKVITDAATAALAIRPLAGDLSYGLFAVGLLAASFLGLTIVPLATAYVFTELFGYERTLNASFLKGKVFYSFFIVQILIGLIVALFPKINLFGLTLYADYLNGAMVPVIFYFLIRFSESPEIMGARYITRGFSKWFLRISAVAITIAVTATVIGGLVFHFK
ncbi:MAG: divalent metal cation transporter [Candidatus Doudnabacteria bacterium]|nr:divalent metal cation transporter [Candidatus Doudnabacteria bacterium]